ncbi:MULTISPECIES: hypothetical protein [unclassified Vibrio]|uniref:hypothetical protein n=1 Tax=unclassified Vibrio TaxID=2614977 RepID=UPI0014829BE6|nr:MULTISPECIES: hypothetical protein [unclassified Vibrio]NNN43511.1 hypothetical protein [Vibrio sp. 1-1(7)]NNN71335.1 hypothetical protein [Vibrio sp. 12-2(3-a)]
MSDIATSIDAIQPMVESSSGSIWGYVVGGLVLVVAAGYFGFKKINQPAFVIKQIRKRNRKAMQKQGIESTEALADLDHLLDAVQQHAIDNGMSGTAMVQLLAPLNDKAKINSAAGFYQSMAYIAKSINQPQLVKSLQNKSKQVKSSSPLMAGLLKRAGV